MVAWAPDDSTVSRREDIIWMAVCARQLSSPPTQDTSTIIFRASLGSRHPLNREIRPTILFVQEIGPAQLLSFVAPGNSIDLPLYLASKAYFGRGEYAVRLWKPCILPGGETKQSIAAFQRLVGDLIPFLQPGDPTAGQ